MEKKREQIFLGRDFSQHQDYSENIASGIDREIKRIVTVNYDRARKILQASKRELTEIAKELLIREVLDADQVTRIARGESLKPHVPSSDSSPASSTDKADQKEDQLPSVVRPVPSLDKAIPQG